MKKLLVVLLSLLMLAGCGKKEVAYNSHLEKIQGEGKLVIATEGMWAPWTYEDEDGNLTGFDVEIGKIIAERLGVEPVFIEGDFDGFLIGLDDGIYDMFINGIDITPDRAAKYDFSDPYVYAYSLLITSSDNEEIKSFADLQGKKFSNSVGSSYEAMGEEYGGTNIGGDTFSDTIENILNKRCDFTINSAETYYDYLKEHADAPVKVVCKSDEALSVAIPFVKDAKEDSLKTEVNKILADLRADGTLAELSVKFFGGDITNK